MGAVETDTEDIHDAAEDGAQARTAGKPRECPRSEEWYQSGWYEGWDMVNAREAESDAALAAIDDLDASTSSVVDTGWRPWA